MDRRDGTWSEPESLGSAIEQRAAIAWVTADGRYLFFKAAGDIYWVDAAIVEAFRPAGSRARDSTGG